MGGLVGYNVGSITTSYANGIVDGNSHVGGLIGNNYGDLVACYAGCNVRGISYVGGLAGYSSSYRADISNCGAVGDVNGNSYVGGLAGSTDGQISNSYSAAVVSGTSYVGGLAGRNNGYCTNCFWDIEASGKNNGVGAGSSYGITGKTNAEMKILSTFTSADWDIADMNGIDNDWLMLADGQDYPQNTYCFYSNFSEPVPLSGNGTKNDPYQIKSAEDFAILGSAAIRGTNISF